MLAQASAFGQLPGRLYLNGNNQAATSVTISPATELTVTTTVQLFSVSFSVKPLNLLTTQNPLSFIHDKIIAPNPIARNI
jgi:phospholipase/lecithinase/hemolysin